LKFEEMKKQNTQQLLSGGIREWHVTRQQKTAIADAARAADLAKKEGKEGSKRKQDSDDKRDVKKMKKDKQGKKPTKADREQMARDRRVTVASRVAKNKTKKVRVRMTHEAVEREKSQGLAAVQKRKTALRKKKFRKVQKERAKTKKFGKNK